MAKHILLIALHEADEIDVRWGKVGETTPAFAERVSLNGPAEENQALIDMAQDSQVVVLIPVRHVLLRECTFHGKPRLATPLNLAYSQESTLLSDIEKMHWVILGKRQEQYGLAGVEQSYLESVLEQLAARGIHPDKVVPDVLALPLSEGGSVARYDDHWWVRTSEWQGRQFPCSWESDLLTRNALFQEAGTDATGSVKELEITGDFLWYLAKEAADNPFNLLQGGFKVTGWRTWLRLNLLPCALLLAACSLMMGGLHYQQVAGQAGRQMTALYQSQLPGERMPKDPVVVTEKRIRLTQQSLNESQFFKMLPRALETLSSSAGQPQVQSLRFDASEKQLSITLEGDPIVLPEGEKPDDITIQLHPGTQPNQTVMTIEELP